MAKDIRLANGELIEIKVNFYTMKLLADYGLKKLEKDAGNDDKQFIAAGHIIYAILRSQGLKIDAEEAMMLVPLDDTTIFDLFEEFNAKLEKFKKKRAGMM